MVIGIKGAGALENLQMDFSVPFGVRHHVFFAGTGGIAASWLGVVGREVSVTAAARTCRPERLARDGTLSARAAC